VNTRELRGRPYTVTFLYTSCPDVCPLIGQELGEALGRLGRASGKVAVVAVSVDPKGDTAEAARSWLRRHRLPSNFHYGIGSERELRPVWKAHFVAPQAPGSAESLHTASIWLVDARGRWRTKFSGGAPVPPGDIAHDLRLLLREGRG
jgi:protein SCO1